MLRGPMMFYGKGSLLRHPVEYRPILEDDQPSRGGIEVIYAPYRTILFEPPESRLTADINIALSYVNEDPPQHKNYRQ